jgi:hypothetical protein
MDEDDQEEPAEETDVSEHWDKNDRTAVPRGKEALDDGLSALGPRESFLIAYDRLADLAASARAPALAIGAVSGRSRVVASQLLPVGNAVTIGRHTRCGLKLSSSRISLRHIVALAVAGGPGKLPTLRLWDLNTGKPFRTEGGQENGAIAAEGATYISIGQYAIWFLPCGPGRAWPLRAIDGWASLPARTFVDRRAPLPPSKRAGVPGLPRHKPMSDPPGVERTWITSLAPPLLLGEDDAPEIAWGTIRLQCGHDKARRRVSAERLEQGILVGRYERCGLSLGERDVNVSRVHLLLVRIGGDIWAIDTGSTNGVRRKGAPLDAAVLADDDRLEFGTRMVLDWNKISHPSA